MWALQQSAQNPSFAGCRLKPSSENQQKVRICLGADCQVNPGRTCLKCPHQLIASNAGYVWTLRYRHACFLQRICEELRSREEISASGIPASVPLASARLPKWQRCHCLCRSLQLACALALVPVHPASCNTGSMPSPSCSCRHWPAVPKSVFSSGTWQKLEHLHGHISKLVVKVLSLHATSDRASVPSRSSSLVRSHPS